MTTPPTHPDLLSLLRGELSNAEVLDAADHLDQCDMCRHELAQSATGHALITSSARTLGSLPAGTETGTTDVEADASHALPPSPDLVGFRRRQRRSRLTQGLVAATIAAVIWSGGYLTAAGNDSSPALTPAPIAAPPPPSNTRTAVLTAIEGSASGKVTMSDEGANAVMRIETTDLRPARAGHFYYAWLLDPVTNKMLPLGQVGPGGTASFEVSRTLLAAYSAVDVSLEIDDGDPAHSPRSVLRAVYA